jgi:hypothetical protein
MTTQNEEAAARQIFENRYPEESLRRIVLEVFAEAILEANRYGRDCWVVQMDGDKIRLVVGHYIVLDTWREGVWLALDKQPLESKRYIPDLKQLAAWGWQEDVPGAEGAYLHYKDKSRRTDFSSNGYYQIGLEHAAAWPHLRRLFFEFIYEAVYYGQPMDPRSPAGHVDGVLKYLRNELGVFVPDPQT